MRRTFRSDQHQAMFQKEGYIMIEGFLEPAEIHELREFYFQNRPESKGFHATMHFHDIEYRRKVHSKISSIFTPKADKLLLDYRPTVSNFTVKEPGKESFFDFHLDWNMVDEKVCRSVTIWCPLEDTTEENGNLWILERSHELGDSYRCGPGLALYFENPEDLKKTRLRKKSLPMKAGDAIIYDHKLFHGSPPNMSRNPRIAINQAMLPADFPSLHYTSRREGQIDLWEVDDDYYCRCIIGETMEEGKLVGRIKLPSSPVQQKRVNRMIVA